MLKLLVLASVALTAHADILSNMCFHGYCVHKCNDGKCGSNECYDSLSRCPILAGKLRSMSACEIISEVARFKGRKSHGTSHGTSHGSHGMGHHSMGHRSMGHSMGHSSMGHHSMGHSDGECNVQWVGDGYCDRRCMAWEADGGDCVGKTHDDSGYPLWDSSSTSTAAVSLSSSSRSDCNPQWVGDGYCDHRCVAWDMDGGDCVGKTHDDAGYSLLHMGSAHMGSAHMGSAHMGSAHMGSAHMGSAHMGSAHMGSAHMGSAHLGSNHLGSNHMGSAHMGSAHMGSAHKDSTHMGHMGPSLMPQGPTYMRPQIVSPMTYIDNGYLSGQMNPLESLRLMGPSTPSISGLTPYPMSPRFMSVQYPSATAIRYTRAGTSNM